MFKIYFCVDYFSCISAADCTGKDASYTFQNKAPKLDNLLNVAPASFDGLYFFFFDIDFLTFCFILGALLQVNSGTYNMMCTRNNNFSNRAQKGTLIVT
jgi:hypothetical protein